MNPTRTLARLVVWTGTLALLTTLALAAGPLVAPVPAAAAPLPALTFGGVVRATGHRSIFVANADGTGVRTITPNDGREYEWGRFAFGNTKIVYTVHSSAPGSPEDLALMDVDGSNTRVLRRFEYDIMQPVVDRSGIFVYYAAKTSFFSRVAHFRLDLRTNLITNITAVGSPTTGQDVDPNLSATGKSVLFVRNPAGRGAEIALMNTNGTDRRAITSLAYHNTDPSPSPDGRRFVAASYRGYGKRSQANPAVPSSTGIPEYYHLVVQDLRRGAAQTVLTGGVNCTIRVPLNACGVQEMSAFVPRFTPDGRSISFTGARDYRRTCLCVIDVDRSDPRVLFESADVALDWHSWAQPAGYPTSTAHIRKAYSTELLVVLSGPGKVKRLAVGYPDLATRTYIPLPSGLQPIEARWGPGRRTIVFTANVRVGTRKAPHPAPPRGSTRKVHALPKGAARTSATVAERQVFLLNRADGRVRQLTDPWIEDWRDGLPAGDARGNYRPRISPDGKVLYVTNVSTRTGESFLLRIDLTTGAVRNLTRPATAVVRKDADPVLSSGGTRLVFTRSEGGTRDLFVMDAVTGGNLTRLRNDATSAAAPAWAPDNSYLLYTSIRNGGSVIVRVRLTGTTRAGDPVVASGGRKSASAAIVSPNGSWNLFLAPTSKGTRIYTKRARGTSTALVQPDLVNNVLSVDWR